MIRHLVFMKFAAEISKAERDAMMRDLESLRFEINGMEDFRAGQKILLEMEFVHGLTDLFWIDFRDLQARDAYLANEMHKAISSRIMASLDGGAKGILGCGINL